MADLDIQLLGPLKVTRNGRPVTNFKSDKAKALLAYLASEVEHPHPRGVLAGLLWPGISESKARRNLSHTLSSLKKTLVDSGGDLTCFLTTRETLQFNINSRCRVDLWDLEAILDSPPVEGLENRLEIYRGPFLDGFSLEGNQAFEAWRLTQEERVRTQIMDALHWLGTRYGEQGDFNRALAVTRRALKLEPLRESVHRRVMQLLADKGQRSKALAQYKTCQDLLQKELGVEPSYETIRLYQAISDQAPDPPEPTPHWDNLPRQTTPFIGREAALSALDDLLNDSEVPLVTIHGPGGIGKTRLAVQAAMGQRSRFEDGIYFIRLGPINDPEQIVPAIAAAVGFTFYQSRETSEDQLFYYLRDKSILLVCDHFEHLGFSATLIADLLQAAPDLHILVTSRFTLNLSLETVFELGGMASPNPDVPETNAQAESVQLFIQCAQRAKRNFETQPGDLEQIARICRLLNGNPLGIVMLAPWVTSLSLADLADSIQAEIRSLPASVVDSPDKPTILRAVFNFAWDRLNPNERDTLAKLTVFRGGFTYQAAQEVTDANITVLRSLENKSLLLYVFFEGRYRFHNLVWTFAFERLSADPRSLDTVRAAHSAWFTATLETWFSEAQGPRQIAILKLVEADIENARAAWDWEIAQDHVFNLGRALDGLCCYYQWRGLHQEGEVLCFLTTRRLQIDLPASQQSDSPGYHLLARVLAWRCVFSQDLGRFDQAEEFLDQSLEYADPDTQDGYYLGQIGNCMRVAGRPGAAAYYQRSLEACQNNNDLWGQATALVSLGWLAFEAGNFSQAETQFLGGLALHRKLGDQVAIANTLRGLGSTAIQNGNFGQAEDHYRESYPLVVNTSNRAESAEALTGLGWTLILNGRFKRGADTIQHGIDIWGELGVSEGRSHLYTTLGLSAMHQGELFSALRSSQRALAMATRKGVPEQIGYAKWGLGWVFLAQNDLESAEEILSESVQHWKLAGKVDGQAQAWALLATIACEQGDCDRGRAYLTATLRTAFEYQAFLPFLYTHPTLARWLVNQKKRELGMQLFNRAAGYPLIKDSRFFEQFNRRTLVIAGIPPTGMLYRMGEPYDSPQQIWETAENILRELEATP